MIFSAGGVDFEIPDEWWAAAGMEAFATARTGYRRHPPTNADLINVISHLSTSHPLRGPSERSASRRTAPPH